MLTATGKNTMSDTTTTLGAIPKPNPRASSGARTSIGMVWLVTTSGHTARRTNGTAEMATARATPATVPTTSPISVSSSVVTTCPPSTWRES